MQIKNDKLDLIASIFEGETFASFDILVNHANQNLL